jgi:hypothetical protein
VKEAFTLIRIARSLVAGRYDLSDPELRELAEFKFQKDLRWKKELERRIREAGKRWQGVYLELLESEMKKEGFRAKAWQRPNIARVYFGKGDRFIEVGESGTLSTKNPSRPGGFIPIALYPSEVGRISRATKKYLAVMGKILREKDAESDEIYEQTLFDYNESITR